MNRQMVQWLGFVLLAAAMALSQLAYGESDGIVNPVAEVAEVDVYEQQWLDPLQVALPDPTRAILLDHMVEPFQWLSANGIAQGSLIPQGRRTMVQFPMSDAQWAQLSEGLCGQPCVVACDGGACKTIQLSALATPVSNDNKLKARIVRNAPDADELDAIDGPGGVCSVGALLPPLTPTEGGVRPNLMLDFSRRDSGSQPRPIDQDAQQDLPSAQPTVPEDPYNLDPEKFSTAAFAMQIAPNFDGSTALRSDVLPADTSDYTLLVGEGCSAVQVPLSSVAPAHVPKLVVAVVAGDPAAVGARYGLTLLNQTQLSSTGDTLVVYWSPESVAQVLPRLKLDADVVVAEREHIFTTTAGGALLGGAVGGSVGGKVGPSYSDPFAPFTYGPVQTGALALHMSSTGEGQTIAVIDTGVAIDHPDLQGRVDHEDFTGRGWSADAHGTAVAGIIAATANNALGSYGVAPSAKILALKACHPKREGSLAARCWTSALVKALDTAMTKDAQIINMSLAGPPDALLKRYVEVAIAQNRLIVAGAGNGGATALPSYPAALPGVLAVTAVDNRKLAYKDANLGDYIDVAAPGVDIVTLSPEDNFPSSSGTSWAAAHVSGIAALLKPLMPLSNTADIAYLLRSQSIDLGAPGKDSQFGFGLVDACAAAAAATASAVTCISEEEVGHAQGR